MSLCYLIGYIAVLFQWMKRNILGLIDETLVWLEYNAGTVCTDVAEAYRIMANNVNSHRR